MNDSLKNLLKYLVYGVIIYLLIIVVPENKTQTSETIMITFVAVGSYMILDSFCASRRSVKEGMDDLDLDLDGLDLDLDLGYSGSDSKEVTTTDSSAPIATKKAVAKEESVVVAAKEESVVVAAREESDGAKEESEAAGKEPVMNAYQNSQDAIANVDSEAEPNMDGECNSVQSCRTQMKDVHSMYQQQITEIRKEHASKISELEDAQRDLNKLNDSTIKSNKSESKVTFGKEASQYEGQLSDADTVTSVYKSTLGKAGTKEEVDEFKQTNDYVMQKMNLSGVTFDKLDDATKKQVLEESQKLILRKQVMSELGIKETAYKDLPKSVKRKVDVMTMLAIDEAKGIVSNNSDNQLKQYVDDTSSKQTSLSKIRSKRMKGDEDWNESRYTEFPEEMNKPLGSYDDTMTNKWNHGYTYLSTDKWSVPMVRPPVCINTTPCNVCPSNTSGYPVNLMDFDHSRKISSTKLNKQYIKDKF
jgi:hypothetical protein